MLDLIIEKEFVLLVSRELVGELGDVVVEPLGFVVGETEVCWEERDGGREGGMGEVVSPELVLEMRDGVVEPVGFVVGETEVCWEGRDGGREGGMGEGDLIVRRSLSCSCRQSSSWSWAMLLSDQWDSWWGRRRSVCVGGETAREGRRGQRGV